MINAPEQDANETTTNNAGANPVTRRTHQPWMFSREALAISGNFAYPNLYPFAGNLRSWLQGNDVATPGPSPHDAVDVLTNPFTMSLRWLVPIIRSIVNDVLNFEQSETRIQPDSVALDIRRVRLLGELDVATARVLEAIVKQLLHCTSFPAESYERSPIGRLFDNLCSDCEEKDKKHTIDLVGSIAHRYKLCDVYGHCLKPDIQAMNLARNSEAAHAGVSGRISRTVEEARITEPELRGRKTRLVHALEHLAKLEDLMTREIVELGTSQLGITPSASTQQNG